MNQTNTRSSKNTEEILQVYKSPAGYDKMISLYESCLQKTSIPYEELDVETTWGTTHVIKSGLKNKKPLVVLHGNTINAPLMFMLSPELTQDFVVYYVDIMGQLGKSVPRKIPVKKIELTNWLNEVFTGLNIEKAHILGSSYGSYIAQCFLQNHPEKVNKLVLTLYTFLKKQGYLSPLLLIKLLYYSQKKNLAATEKLLDSISGSKIKDSEVNNIVIEFFTNAFKHTRNGRQVLESSTVEALKAINSPVQIIIGEQDPFFNAKKGEDLCREVNNPCINFNMIPGMGHFTNDRSEEIYGKAANFLKQT
ncbi:MAG: alpha/beta hydrolase [bacterium]|nr:alpha/beta hydrolase [bacterium]